jgi:hypothetical protein
VIAANNEQTIIRKQLSRYRKPSFYIVRGCIALMAGILLRVFCAQIPYAAFAIGVAAQLVITRLPSVIFVILSNHGTTGEGSVPLNAPDDGSDGAQRVALPSPRWKNPRH